MHKNKDSVQVKLLNLDIFNNLNPTIFWTLHVDTFI